MKQLNCSTNVNLIQTNAAIDDGEIINYTTYGISLSDESGTVIFLQEDISANKEIVENLISWCVEGEARAENFEDYIEDYLYEHVWGL